jgi:hypothetical protein
VTADSWAKPNVGGFEPVIGLMVRFSVVQEAVCQGNVKQHLRNAVPTRVNDLREGVKRGFARLRRLA